jgi:glycine dehydrogenase subunit 1
MLRELGFNDIEQLFEIIPERLRFKGSLGLPSGPSSEYEVKRRVETILSKNKSWLELRSFVGGGCWQHWIPAACDEINARSEFLTAYAGDAYSDLGRYQAIFEFQSMIGELVDMDAVMFPLYDWSTASGDAIRMAATVTGRNEVLYAKSLDPERLAIMRALSGSIANFKPVEYDRVTGQIDINNLKHVISDRTAAIYLENPNYLGPLESEAEAVGKVAHNRGALFVVGAEPISLGVISPPGAYGADIVTGEAQPLGIHPFYGGALLGYLAFRDEERFATATGHRLITITKTEREGQWGFTQILPERTMYAARDKSVTFTGTATALWAITAAVYLSLLGPEGIRELATSIIQKARYAMTKVSEIQTIKAPKFESPHFEEFTINFDATKKTVEDVNKFLLKRNIQGGKSLKNDFPELGNTALCCVTEVHTKSDIDDLVEGIKEAVST